MRSTAKRSWTIAKGSGLKRCLRAFWEARALPSGVLGPLERGHWRGWRGRVWGKSAYGSKSSLGEPIAKFRISLSSYLRSGPLPPAHDAITAWWRSEEHTSELQSLRHLVC